MASKGSGYSNDLLKLIFNATPIANIADSAAVSPLANLYVSLHTAPLTAASDQESDEALFGSYSRIALPRNGSNWIVTGNSVSPANEIEFAAASSGSETEVYFGIGTALSGAGQLLYWGPISPVIVVTTGIAPKLGTDTMVIEI